MKNQTWYIVILLILLILLSLFLGKKIIHEGLDILTAGPGPVLGPNTNTNYPNYKGDLNNTNLLLTSVDNTQKDLVEEKRIQESRLKAAEAAIKDVQGKISSKEVESESLLEETIKNAYVPEVVYLKLYGDTINIADDLGISDPSNMMKRMNVDMNGKATNIDGNHNIDGKLCVKFTYDPTNPTILSNSLNNYISFPFINPSQFSFSVWVYINPNDSNYYTILSITNNKYLTPSVQLDVQGSNIMIYCALPNVKSPLHSKPVSNKGWTYVTYTYDSKANSSMYINKDLVSSFTANGIFHNENIRYRPNYFFIGRSGDIKRGYNGYLHDFTYYALVLQQKDVVEMYDYTIKQQK